ncbi:MAG: hypothetical protein IJ905_16125 [Fibrobacter sp.]|nr:hypothetical protein [Fibrobacter sp.]
MAKFFRKKLHKITLLLTAVFWANCGAAEEKQDTPQKEPVKDSIKTVEKKIEIVEFYYGVPAPYDYQTNYISIEVRPYDIDDAISETSKQYSRDLLVNPSMKQ